MAVELKIIGHLDGRVEVHGEILKNKAACYSLLEMARDAIKDFHDRAAAQQRIVPASSMPHGTLPNGGG